ncbi:uncharacterized protein Dwil_GK11936 [Drosophila willistoni]|uniref:RING-type domain-containing protein n=1 Tax=Drosophila willistoni TaxID=7260 RepID=B4NBN4_DROWI|nr:uncharacterized protein LOC6647464 [Drosophila willistoni]EDW81198.2 uncharacterized protein Dwil_GK11936 [Drosophila willistoni]
MNNSPKDVSMSGGAGYRRGQVDNNAVSGISISIESDDNESTTAEHEYLLPAGTSSSVTSAMPGSSATTGVHLDHGSNLSGRSSSLTTGGGVGASRYPSHHGNIISSFLARQRSYTPPMRVTTQVNRRLQPSRSMGANNASSPEETSPSPVVGASSSANSGAPASSSASGVRQLGNFWRVNLNEVISLSTAPSTEALRSFITHSNFRYQPAPTGSAATSPVDNSHILINNQPQINPTAAAAGGSQEAATSPSSPLRMNRNGQGHMGRSISLREGEMRHTHGLTGSRHNASVIGLSSSSNGQPPTYEESEPVNSAHPERIDNGSGGGGGNPDAGTDNAAIPADAHEHNGGEDEPLISDMVVQILSHFVRYLPIIGILLTKFIHDHLLGILDLLVLQTVMYNVNRSVRHQVARLAQKNYVVLIRDAVLVGMVVLLRLFMASAPPDPFGLIVPPPKKYFSVEVTALPYKTEGENAEKEIQLPQPTSSSSETLKATFSTDTYDVLKVIPLGMLLYYVAVSDLIIKLLTMFIKLAITMLPMHVLRLKVRARLYVLVEYLSQFYRALTPITQWFYYLYESYSGLEVISGGFFCSMYLGAKIFELIERGKSLKKAIVTFRRNIDSERPPTKDELDAAGSVCPICHDSYNTPTLLECGHIFCDECVQTWFKREQTCPMCRAKVSDDPAWQDGSTTFFHQLY